MSETREVLPVEAWVDDAPDGGVQLYSPFVRGRGIILGQEVEYRDPLDTLQPPPELDDFSWTFGLDFRGMLVAMKPDPDVFSLNVLLAETGRAEDLAYHDDPEQFRGLVAAAPLTIYGLNRSLVQLDEQRGLWVPRAVEDTSDFELRLVQVSQEFGRPFKNCDVESTGEPSRKVRLVRDAAQLAIMQMQLEGADPSGMLSFAADEVHLNVRQWHTALRIVEHLDDLWRSRDCQFFKSPLVVLPPEDLDVCRKLGQLGIPNIGCEVAYEALDATGMQVAQRCLEEGRIPAELLR